jgi:hypothetical protein
MSGVAATETVPIPLDKSLQWGEGQVEINNVCVDLPLMGCSPMSTLEVSSGYLIATAENSQRLWIIDSP